MIRSHKIRLIPAEQQKQHLFRAFAASRNAWNFAKDILDLENRYSSDLYRATGENYKFTSITVINKKTRQDSIKSLYNKRKPFWLKGTGTATQEAIADIQKALSRYFDIQKGKIKLPTKDKTCRKCGASSKISTVSAYWTCGICQTVQTVRKDGFRAGWLHWRRRGYHESFRQTYVSLKFDNKKISYNAQVGYIKMSESVRFPGNPKNATFSFDGIHFWVSVVIETDLSESPIIIPEKKGDFIGVDVGVKNLATTSQHDKPFVNPRALSRHEPKLARLQRKLDRQKRANNPDNYDHKGRIIAGKRLNWNVSNQMRKTDKAIRKLQIRITNIRRNGQHHLTSELSKGWGHVAYEDLNIRGMLKNPKLAKHIQDAGFGEIRRQLEYKSGWYESEPVLVDRFFPSSKTCSNCKEVNHKLTLKDRLWICDNCGQFHDRDENAAVNLENEARRIVENGETGL